MYRGEWPGHAVIVGMMGSGKTYSLLGEISQGGAVLVDLNADAPVESFVQGQVVPMDWRYSPARVWEQARPGWVVHYVPHSTASAAVEVEHLCAYLDRVNRTGNGIGPRTLAIDEAQAVAEQGRVGPMLREAWDRGRHWDLRIVLATPVPQLVDHHLRLTASTVIVHRIAWSDWMTRLGLQESSLQGLMGHERFVLKGGQMDGKAE